MAETINLGIVGIKNMGEYDSQTQYEKLNVVTYEGSSYCALRDTVGNLPTNTNYWQLYAKKGDTGDTGDTGPQGPQGPRGPKGDPSGAPLAVSSTVDMTDTTKVYVNTTDGHWYFYNGSSWEDGGVYQATAIENGSITPPMLFDNNNIANIGSSIVGLGNYKYGGYINGNTGKFTPGQSAAGLNYYTDYIDISNISGTLYNHSQSYLNIVFYDENKDYISGSLTFPLQIPATAKYIRSSTLVNANQTLQSILVTTSSNSVNSNYYKYFLKYLETNQINSLLTDGKAIFDSASRKVIIKNCSYVSLLTQKSRINLYNSGSVGNYELFTFSDFSGVTRLIFFNTVTNEFTFGTKPIDPNIIILGFIYNNKQIQLNGLFNIQDFRKTHEIDFNPAPSISKSGKSYIFEFSNNTKYYDRELTQFYIQGGTAVANSSAFSITLNNNEILYLNDNNEIQKTAITNMISSCLPYPNKVLVVNINGIFVDGFAINQFLSILINQNIRNLSSYCIDGSLIKTSVKTETIGSIMGVQSFCIYNDYYYSTDGGYIWKQDSDLNQISVTQISVGHGNSMQIGHSNLCYISGWNDNKVYVVNLDTLLLDSEINLPTTGYTNAVIDDINNIAYILQRDSYPSTPTYYNFIKYDLTNHQIISTSKINKAFGALQSCDLYDDKIIILYGLNNDTIPNGCLVLDLNGNIISSIHLDINEEPEGVAINRDTEELYVTYHDGTLYKLIS